MENKSSRSSPLREAGGTLAVIAKQNPRTIIHNNPNILNSKQKLN
ncbi:MULTISPECIES: hypothetical protein [Flavobacterium]|nr:hypothetical protein [Flavobacterium sp. N1846]